MKNLRKAHPLIKPFRQQTQQDASVWPGLDLNTRIDLCSQFILLPLIENNKTLNQDLLDQTLPAAIDLERMASSLWDEGQIPFHSIRDLLDKTTSLFLMTED